MGQRSWVSLLVGFLFVVVSLTGVALFFHVRMDSLKTLHELAGLIFIVIGAVHAVFNGRALLSCLNDRKALIALAAAALVLGIVVSHVGDGRGQHRGPGGPSHHERAG